MTDYLHSQDHFDDHLGQDHVHHDEAHDYEMSEIEASTSHDIEYQGGRLADPDREEWEMGWHHQDDESGYYARIEGTDFSIWMPDQFDTTAHHAEGDVIGTPVEDMAEWHLQETYNSCSIAAQEFMLESITHREFSEAQLRAEAETNGWYFPTSGTPLSCMGNLLEAHGVPVERSYGMSLDDLSAHLDRDHKIMVALDSQEIWTPHQSALSDDLLGDFPGIPGQDSNHAVEVIGIDNSDPQHPLVILNDPGHPAGQGMLVPADEFLAAWNDSGRYTVVAYPEQAQAQELTVGGMWNLLWSPQSIRLTKNVASSVLRTTLRLV